MSKASLELGGGNWAAKDGKLLGYAVGDTSGKYLPREFTFSRGADIGATRVNKDGLIEKYRENLLLHSNTFSNAVWAGASTTETGGQSGYDGTNNAWLLEKLVANGNIEQSVSANNLLTYSVYAKAGTKDWLRLNVVGLANAYFDLANGVVGSTGGAPAITSAMVNAGGGWWRCSFTYNNSSTTGVSIYVADADNDSSGTSGNIYIQDAQLEQGLVATDYLESDDETGKAGVLDNLPRIDYTSGSAQLLMEPSRTNYIENSEYFNANSWTKQAKVTITDNATTSPSGYNDASKYNISGSTDRALDQSETLSSGATYTFSMWVKAIVDTQIRVRSNGNEWSEIFTVLVSDGWKRIESTHTMVSTSYEFGFFDVSGSTGDRFYIWGAQLEAGSFATSYIPNYGTAIGVTRNADSCSKTGVSSLIGQSEGTIFIEADLSDVEDTIFRGIAELNDGGTLNRITIFRNNNGTIRLYVRESGSVQMDDTYSTSVSGTTKIAVAYKTNDIAFYVNGNQVALDTSATIPSCSDVDLGVIESNSSKTLNDRINQALLFTTRLSNTELAALTTL